MILIKFLFIFSYVTRVFSSHGTREDYIDHGTEHVKINIPRQFFIDNTNWRKGVIN